MPAEPDHAALIAGMHTVVERLNAGESWLPALTRLLDVGYRALGAAGMILTEFGDRGGRVLVGVGASSWAAGRPVPLSCHDFHLGTGSTTWEVPVTELPEEIARQLSGRGLRRLLGARLNLDGRHVGGLHAYFTEPEPLAAAHRSMLAFIGACAVRVHSGWWRRHGPPPEPPYAFDKDLFVATTSHELRTPVTVIKGFANTLHDHWEVLEPEQRRNAVLTIRQRADELARLVDRLLTASTTADPAGLPMRIPFDVVTAVREVVAGLPPDLRSRLRLRVPETLPKVYGDRASLPTVLTELLNNAMKYSDGEVELSAFTDELTVVFEVADRGVGIAPEHVELAFEPYWQADRGDRRARGGAGLGLHLVRRIVERQEGWVSLRPRDSGGTVAEVRLPRADAAGPH
jgi:two-component system phosphate regulon sensor histidine kinase PhoR